MPGVKDDDDRSLILISTFTKSEETGARGKEMQLGTGSKMLRKIPVRALLLDSAVASCMTEKAGNSNNPTVSAGAKPDPNRGLGQQPRPRLPVSAWALLCQATEKKKEKKV